MAHRTTSSGHIIGSLEPVDVSFDELVAATQSVVELRVAAERAYSAGRLRYGNELEQIANTLEGLIQKLRT